MNRQLPIYLDYNATTPCDPEVVEAMLPYFTTNFGNPASHTHSFGWQAEEAVDVAREQIAALIGSEPGEIFFTSGATEATNLALKGAYDKYSAKGNLPTGQAGHIITCNIEHKAVLDTCKQLERRGAVVTYLEVDSSGLINPGELESAIRPETILISLMYANNEIGTIMPIREIGEIAKKHKVIFFSDATQAIGKVPVDVNHDAIDMMAFSAHKFYGPKGVGALYVRRKNPRVHLTAQIDGGGHQKGTRSGTLNVPGIVGLGKACEISLREMKQASAMMKSLRDKLEQSLLQSGEAWLNGDKIQRLPNVSNISFKYADGDSLLRAISKNVAVSSGSACTSATPEPSYVLKALGLDDEKANGSIRFSLGRMTSEEEIDFVIKEVTGKWNELKQSRPLIEKI